MNRPIRLLQVPLAFVIALALPAAPGLAAGPRPSAKKLAAEIDRLFTADSSHARARLKVVRPSYTREMELESWSRGDDDFLIRILAPPSDAGSVTLKRKGQLWQYHRRLDRVIRLPSGVMGSAWMGSHFTHNDLARTVHYDKDYTARYEGAAEAAEWTLILVPRPEAPVVWSRLVCTVRASDHMPLRIAYRDQKDRTKRTLEFGDFRKTGGRTVPFRLVMRPSGGKGHSELRYTKLDLGVPAPERMFSPTSLRRR